MDNSEYIPNDALDNLGEFLDRRRDDRLKVYAEQPADQRLLYQYATTVHVLDLSDCVALIQGRNPPVPSREAVGEVLDEYRAAVALFKRDWEGGTFPKPMTPAEFVAWAESRSITLPEYYVECVLRQVEGGAGTVPSIKAGELFYSLYKRSLKVDVGLRPRGKAATRAEIERVMRILCEAARKKGIPLQSRAMPGTSTAFIGYLQSNSEKLHGLAHDTLKDHLRHLGYRWKQGGKKEQSESLVNGLMKYLSPS